MTETDHTHMECVWCGFLWKEVDKPKMVDHTLVDHIKNHCPRCGGMGCKTEKRA